MPLDKIAFPHLHSDVPCINCTSSTLFVYSLEFYKSDQHVRSDILTMRSPSGDEEGVARIHCSYLKRGVESVSYLTFCPFFSDE